MVGQPRMAARAHTRARALRARASAARVVHLRQTLPQATAFGTALLIVGSAFALAMSGVEAQPRPGFSQLWLLPTADSETVAIGIRNQESRTINVRLELTRDTSIEEVWPSITLHPGQTWQITATVSGFSAGTPPLEATLTLAESPQSVYRRVTLWPSG
jgi:hypothetical protein